MTSQNLISGYLLQKTSVGKSVALLMRKVVGVWWKLII